MHTDYFFGLFHSGNIRADSTVKVLKRLCNRLNDEEGIEITFHPGMVLEDEKQLRQEKYLLLFNDNKA